MTSVFSLDTLLGKDFFRNKDLLSLWLIYVLIWKVFKMCVLKGFLL